VLAVRDFARRLITKRNFQRLRIPFSYISFKPINTRKTRNYK